MVYLFLIRLISLIIMYMVFLIVVMFIPRQYNHIWRRWLNGIGMRIANFTSITCHNQHIFDNLVDSDSKFLIVANHTNLYDGFLLTAALGKLSFLVDLSGVGSIPLLTDMLQYCTNTIIIDKDKSSVERMQEYVQSRRPGEDALVIFADAMQQIPHGDNVAPFKSGAFRVNCHVLPVVITFKNHTIDPIYRWYDQEHFFESSLKRFIDTQCDVEIHVLDPVPPSPHDFRIQRDTVHRAMNRFKCR